MGRNRQNLALTFWCLHFILIACSEDDGNTVNDGDIARFGVITDTHLYDPSLGVEGPAFEDYLSNDRKLIAESDAINTALKNLVIAEDIDFVLVAGDLTKDGVKQSHELMARYLADIESSGKKVYVVPGNHDILNAEAHSYPPEGDPISEPNITAEEFASIYGAFGYDEALERDPDSLTYIAEPTPGIWILGIDGCNYGQKFPGETPIAGDLSEETLDWIAKKLIVAREQGIEVLGLMHHGIVEHFPDMASVFGDYLLKNWRSKAEAFTQMGVNIVFTGHHHATDISKHKTANGSIYDVQTGSAVTWRCPYRTVEYNLETRKFDIENTIITEIDYDTDGLDFQEYALQFLERGLPNMVLDYLRDFGVDEDALSNMEPVVTQTLLAYYSGDEFSWKNRDTFRAEAQTIAGSEHFLIALVGRIMLGIWDDQTPDGNVIIDFAADTIEPN